MRRVTNMTAAAKVVAGGGIEPPIPSRRKCIPLLFNGLVRKPNKDGHETQTSKTNKTILTSLACYDYVMTHGEHSTAS
jgi:hypothetical protein